MLPLKHAPERVLRTERNFPETPLAAIPHEPPAKHLKRNLFPLPGGSLDGGVIGRLGLGLLAATGGGIGGSLDTTALERNKELAAGRAVAGRRHLKKKEREGQEKDSGSKREWPRERERFQWLSRRERWLNAANVDGGAIL